MPKYPIVKHFKKKGKKMSYNKVVLVGNLTRDIDLRYSQGGMGIAKAAIATSRKFKSNGESKEEVCFVDLTFFGRSAEIANQYLRKGSKILVEGRLNLEQWVDQNGQKRSKHSVTVEVMQMLGSRNDNQNADYSSPANDSYADHPLNPPNAKEAADLREQHKRESKLPSSDDIPEIDLSENDVPF